MPDDKKVQTVPTMGDAPKPGGSPAPKDAAKPADATPATGTQPGFRVSLKDNPSLFIPATEAHDRLAAIELYKQKCGILSTIHPFSVAPDNAPVE